MRKLLFLLLLCGCTIAPGTHVQNKCTGQRGVVYNYLKSYDEYTIRYYEYKDGYVQPEATYKMIDSDLIESIEIIN